LRVVLLNTHSVLNAGDAAIVAAEIGLLREVLGSVQITATSRTPQKDFSFFEDLGAEVLPPILPAPSVWRSAGERLAGCAGNLLSLGGKRRLIRAIASADLVVSSGGGYFFSNRRLLPGPMFWQAYVHVRLAERLGKPVLFAPQSFGPFANHAAGRLLKRLVSDPTVVRAFARERESLTFLHGFSQCGETDARFAICPDLAFAFEADRKGALAGDTVAMPRPVLGVTVREWGFPECRGRTEKEAKRASYIDGIVASCGSFHARTGGSLIVIPQSRGPGRLEDDRAISRELVEHLAGVISGEFVSLAAVAEDASPQHVLGLVASVDVMLATRFHSAIFACLAGKPFVAVGYQPKTAGIMTMLGLTEFSVPIEEVTGERLAAILEKLVRDGQSIMETRIRPATTRLAAEARSTMKNALLSFVAGGRP
jgi:colanic acid/amylovoran biosynthesis protein